MNTPWRALPISQVEGSQNFIVRHTFSSQSYTVEISDLSILWREQLDRRSIIKRALLEDTSIDPSEDNTQLNILLQKIKAPFQGEEGTTLSVTHDQTITEVKILVTSPLPHPLQPLEWTFRLRQQTSESLRDVVIVPLLRKNRAQYLQKEHLIRSIRDKDSVITKLRDGLATAGVSIANIFPRAAAQGKLEPGSAGAVAVRGLEPFDEDTWRKEWNEDSQNSPAWTQLVELAFDVDGVANPSSTVDENAVVPVPTSTIVHKTQTEGEPVTSRTQTQHPTLQRSTDTHMKADLDNIDELNTPSTEEDITDGEDTGFQVQTISSKEKAHTTTRLLPQSPTEPTSTSISTAEPATTYLAAPPPTKPKKLGTIGGGRAMATPSPPADQSVDQLTNASNTPSTLNITPRSTQQSHRPPPAPAPAPAAPAARTPSPKRAAAAPKKLGHIGGRAPASSNPSGAGASSAGDPPAGAPQLSPPGLPTVPFPTQADDGPSNVGAGDESEGAQSAAQAARKSETAEEKAVRRREELKRELEAKRIAGARKKRKF